MYLEKVTVHITGHIEDDKGYMYQQPRTYWATATYQLTKLLNDKYALNPIKLQIHQEVGLLEGCAINPNSTTHNNLLINDSVWVLHKNGNGIEAKLTKKGKAKLKKYIRENGRTLLSIIYN